ncbi:hypothetical protein ACFL60_03105 [Candidatus Omnitrophota bacterium]
MIGLAVTGTGVIGFFALHGKAYRYPFIFIGIIGLIIMLTAGKKIGKNIDKMFIQDIRSRLKLPKDQELTRELLESAIDTERFNSEIMYHSTVISLKKNLPSEISSETTVSSTIL